MYFLLENMSFLWIISIFDIKYRNLRTGPWAQIITERPTISGSTFRPLRHPENDTTTCGIPPCRNLSLGRNERRISEDRQTGGLGCDQGEESRKKRKQNIRRKNISWRFCFLLHCFMFFSYQKHPKTNHNQIGFTLILRKITLVFPEQKAKAKQIRLIRHI